MIEIRMEQVQNREHFCKLLAFCREVMAVCSDLGITPVLSGSLAMAGYTQTRAMRINDIDLACSELEFPRLSQGLEAKCISHEVRPWHVLQALKDDLKVEFDSTEHWLSGLTKEYKTLQVDGLVFKVVSLSDLRELYRRGLEATSREGDEAARAKHLDITQKYEALCLV